MKLITTQEKLKEGLNIIERVAAKSLTLPILNNVLISAEKNFLALSATDLEVGINWWTLSKIEKEGKLTIPSRILSGFISLLPNKKITLEAKNNDLFLDCDAYKTQIKGVSAEEFPIIPKITEGDVVVVSSDAFCQGLNQVADVATPSTARPEISGVYLFFQKNLITITATDSFRLGEKKIILKNDSPLKKEYALIIPQKSAKEIINIFGEKGGDLKIYFSANQIMCETNMAETDHPKIQMVSRLIEGEYPNYQEIIPKKYTTQLILQKNEFLNQIKSASLFSGKINEVKLKTDGKKGEIEIFSQNAEIGEYQSSIPAKIKGENTEISFNHRFLLDGLANIKSAEVVFGLNGNAGPGVLRPADDSNYLYVVMPIKAS